MAEGVIWLGIYNRHEYEKLSEDSFGNCSHGLINIKIGL